MKNFRHKVLYYGPQEIETVKNSLNTLHQVPETLSEIPASYKFEEKTLDNTVYLVDFDMKQAEIMMLSNGGNYNAADVPVVTLYNSYFGGGMSSVIFQDLRESKALAYSTHSQFMLPNKITKKTYNRSYIGSQADKLAEAMKGLNDLLTDMPKADGSFVAAKELVLQEMRSQRITKTNILFNYLTALNLENKTDIRKDVFEKVQNFTFNDIKKFHESNIKGKDKTILVLGKKDNLDIKTLEKYGTVKTLTLKEVFGY